MIEHRAPTY